MAKKNLMIEKFSTKIYHFYTIFFFLQIFWKKKCLTEKALKKKKFFQKKEKRDFYIPFRDFLKIDGKKNAKKSCLFSPYIRCLHVFHNYFSLVFYMMKQKRVKKVSFLPFSKPKNIYGFFLENHWKFCKILLAFFYPYFYLFMPFYLHFLKDNSWIFMYSLLDSM